MVGHRTCDSQVAGSSHGQVSPHDGLGCATYTCVPLSPSSIGAVMLFGWEGNHRPGGK